MRIIVNDESHETAAATVATALDELGFAAAVVATALNGEFVPTGQRSQTPLVEGDRLDVLAPMQGG
jgi:sulfur carrier protein